MVLLAIIVLGGVPAAAEPLVSMVNVEGNEHVVAEHILAVVGAKVGEPLDRKQLQADVEAIYNLGFFSFVDINLQSIAGGVGVTYIVRENPVVERITFTGNNIYTDEELLKVVFTVPGNVFNRVFFRHDLDRIQEKYHNDGYVMVKIADVQVESGVIDVKIVEPKVGEIVIQGNRTTKTHVIAREIKLKKGDPFNTIILRHSINKLQNKGFFEDVNVGFEPGKNPEETDIIITVSEQKTGKLGLSISHGSESGFSGGLVYTDSNWKGLGRIGEVGFETGDDEQYWISYSEPYMDAENYAWKVGFMKRTWEERNYYRYGEKRGEYDEDMTNFYAGFGKKFKRDEKLSWYLTLDWRNVDYDNYEKEENEDAAWEDTITTGKIFSVLGTITRNNTDPYLSYSKGDVIDLNVEQAFEFLGGEYDYTKYWVQARYYTPVKGISDFFDTPSFGDEFNPILFAARMRLGFSSGGLPTAGRYSIGGTSTLRGYEKREFEGESVFLANAELRVPMADNFGLVVFYDTGNAWEGNNISLSDLHDAWGIGVRVKTPLGNFRLDYAQGEEDNKTHFGLGEIF